MRILVWSSPDIENLQGLSLVRVITEVDDEGFVIREIGLSDHGVAYRVSPMKATGSFRGLFDNQQISAEGLAATDEMTSEQFENLWNAPDHDS